MGVCMEAILNFLQSAFDYLTGSGATLAASIAIILEVVMRATKTEKPKSFLWALQGIVNVAKTVCEKLAQFLGAVAAFIDGIVGQRLK